MKLQILAVILAVPTLSFANGATICYQATQAVPSRVPSLLCLEGISESAQANTLQIDSRNASIPSAVTITKFSRHNEDRYSFVAEAMILNESDGSFCARTTRATLKIAGESTSGVIDPANLAVSVEVESNPDTCNVGTFTDEFSYSRVGAIR